MVGVKAVCERWCVTKMVCERWCVTKMVCERWCVTKMVYERWWMTWTRRRRRRTRRRDTESKTRTPHKDVGKKTALAMRATTWYKNCLFFGGHGHPTLGIPVHVDGGAWYTRPLRLSKKGRDTEATGDVCVNETSLREVRL